MREGGRIASWVISLVLALAAGALAQRPTVNDTVAALRSPDWQEAARGLQALASGPNLLEHPEVRAALVQLMERENTRVTDICNGRIAPDESYSEFNGELVSVVFRTYGLDDPDVLRVLVNSPWNWESELGRALVGQGARVLSLLLDRMASDTCAVGPRRAMMVAGRILGQDRLGRYPRRLEPRLVETARTALVQATVHPDRVYRRTAVAALGWTLDPSAVPILQRLAETDPDDGRDSASRVKFDVRHEALRAIERIRTRSDQPWRWR